MFTGTKGGSKRRRIIVREAGYIVVLPHMVLICFCRHDVIQREVDAV